MEALEFTVHEESRATGVPLSQLHLKKNLLLCCITRGPALLVHREFQRFHTVVQDAVQEMCIRDRSTPLRAAACG